MKPLISHTYDEKCNTKPIPLNTPMASDSYRVIVLLMHLELKVIFYSQIFTADSQTLNAASHLPGANGANGLILSLPFMDFIEVQQWLSFKHKPDLYVIAV